MSTDPRATWGSGQNITEAIAHNLQGSPMIHGEPDHACMPQKLPESNPDNPLYPFLPQTEPSGPSRRG